MKTSRLTFPLVISRAYSRIFADAMRVHFKLPLLLPLGSPDIFPQIIDAYVQKRVSLDFIIRIHIFRRLPDQKRN